MNGLPEIFRGDFSVEIVCLSSILLLLLYGAGVTLLQRWKRTAGRTPAIRQHVICGLGAALVAAAFGFWLHATNVAIASAGTPSGTMNWISPHELHLAIDPKGLPAQHFEDQTFVFPGGTR